MIENVTAFATYCPAHGLLFYTDEIQLRAADRCDKCGAELEIEETLLAQAGLGCNFCKKIPLDSKFCYDEKHGRTYCHSACYRCATRKCVIRGCAAQAKYLMYLAVPINGELTEYLVPTAFCLTHKEAVEKGGSQIDPPILAHIRKLTGDKEIKKEDCSMVLKPY